MTTLIEDLQALLNPLAAGGAHYAVNQAEPPTYPYIVFLRVVSTSSVSVLGPTDLQNTRVQVDLISQSVSGLAALQNSVEAAFASWSVTNVPISSQDIFEADVLAHRCILDYSIWAKN